MNETVQVDIYLVMAVTSVIGSAVRITLEWEKKTLSVSRAILVLLASLVVSYLFYLANDYKGWIPEKYIGFPSIISGIIAIEVVKFFIEELPVMLKSFLRSKIANNGPPD